MDVAKHLVFKGGTSLSKAWNLIERFSEDIDLALDKKFLGYSGNFSVKRVKKLRKASREYISYKFFPELKQKFLDAAYNDVELHLGNTTEPNPEPIIIEIYYKSVSSPSNYTKPRVLVEIGSRSLREPYTVKQFSSLVGEIYPDKPFADTPINISTVNPERTFLEKTFLLHEEFQRPVGKIRVDRLSRHLYDVEKLMDTEFADKALMDEKLYNDIINHRKIFTRIGHIDYNLHQAKTLNPIPPDALIEKWKKDYQTMVEEMIYGDSLSFDKLLERLKELKSKINKINWSQQ